MAILSSILTLIKLLMALVLAMWICLWILRPTQLWKKPWHLAQDWASATFIGDYGLVLLIYCFPVIAVAALCHFYLYLSPKEESNRKRGHLMTIFTNPLVISSPVGILSGCEIIVAAIFVTFLLWTYYINVVGDFRKLTSYKSLHLDGLHLKLMHMGVRVGSLSEACLVLLLLPILRGMSIFRMFGLQFETSVRYHIWIGNILVLFSLLHGVTIMSIWASNGTFLKQIVQWQRTGRVNIAGALALLTGVVIWSTSFQRFRRQNFQLFYISHHLYILFFLFFLLHAGDRHFYLIFAGVLLFALDKTLRILQSRRETCLVSANILPCKAIELSLPKHPNTLYTPTSIVFLKIPSISRFQWHPFSIISSAGMSSKRISLLIKCQGQWTNELNDKLNLICDETSGHGKRLPVAIEGPYGPASFPYQRYTSLILVAGGSGITPFLSIIQDVASRKDQMSSSPITIQLIYMVKRLEDLSMLSLVSGLLLKQLELGHLKLHLFVTQEDGPPIPAVEALQDISHFKMISFETTSSDAIFRRPAESLWKAIFILIPFVIFIASIIIFNHIFLHPKNRDEEKKVPSLIFDLLVILSFFITIASFVVITLLSTRGKSVNDSRLPSHHNTEATEFSPLKFQNTFCDNQINFGKRPNINDILSALHIQRGESEVGVFVCGPQSLQESVALFCRAKSPQGKSDENKAKASFSFHSINFSL